MMTMGGVSYVRPNARLRRGHEKESSTPAQKLALPRGMWSSGYLWVYHITETEVSH